MSTRDEQLLSQLDRVNDENERLRAEYERARIRVLHLEAGVRSLGDQAAKAEARAEKAEADLAEERDMCVDLLSWSRRCAREGGPLEAERLALEAKARELGMGL